MSAASIENFDDSISATCYHIVAQLRYRGHSSFIFLHVDAFSAF